MLGGRICRRGRWAALLAMAAVSAMAAELVRVGARAGAAEERARKAEAMIEELQAENTRLREAASATRQQESGVAAESQEQCLALLGRVLPQLPTFG